MLRGHYRFGRILVVNIMLFRSLPWEYAVRNLFRRRLRTALTFVGLTTVVVLVFVVVGFIRGLELSLSVSGDPQAAVILSLGMGENIEYSSIPMGTSGLVPASITGIEERFGQKFVSPELYLGTQVAVGSREPAMGLIRGVTRTAPLVRRNVDVFEGDWPQHGQVMVGRLAATKLGATPAEMSIGKQVQLEGREGERSGIFSAGGSAFESEIWCRLDGLQQAMKRQDLSLVALTLADASAFSDLDLFCKERLDLELQAIRETTYYDSLQKDYGPVRGLAWLVVLLLLVAGIVAGMNTMYGSVVGRSSEIAALQTIGFGRRAIALSLIQEGLLLAAAASLLAAILSIVFVNGIAVRFTMGAFALRVANVSILVGCGVSLLLGFLGTAYPAYRALRIPIVEGLRKV